jgi:hypothetical protein
VLRHQLNVLRRRLHGRGRLTNHDRSFFNHHRGENHRRPSPTRESQSAVSVSSTDSNPSDQSQPPALATYVAASASQCPQASSPSWAGVIVTTPSAGDGQRKRQRSSRAKTSLNWYSGNDNNAGSRPSLRIRFWRESTAHSEHAILLASVLLEDTSLGRSSTSVLRQSSCFRSACPHQYRHTPTSKRAERFAKVSTRAAGFRSQERAAAK